MMGFFNLVLILKFLGIKYLELSCGFPRENTQANGMVLKWKERELLRLMTEIFIQVAIVLIGFNDL